MEEAPRQSYSNKERSDIFNNEFLPHINSMYNFGYRLTLDRDDAKDLVQDTYLKAYRFIESFQKGTNAKAWLFRILKNSFINDYRKKSKVRQGMYGIAGFRKMKLNIGCSQL